MSASVKSGASCAKRPRSSSQLVLRNYTELAGTQRRYGDMTRNQLTWPSMSRLCHALSSAFWRTPCKNVRRLDSCATSRRLTTGFGRVGRAAYLNLGGCMGDDCVWRCESVFSWMGDRGDDARMGDDDSGDEIDGR